MKKLRSYVINVYSKSNLKTDIYKYYTTKLQTLREEKEDEEDRKKNKKITIILTKNNDIYNTGIVTSNKRNVSYIIR